MVETLLSTGWFEFWTLVKKKNGWLWNTKGLYVNEIRGIYVFSPNTVDCKEIVFSLVVFQRVAENVFFYDPRDVTFWF